MLIKVAARWLRRDRGLMEEHLAEALEALGLEGETEASGRWIIVQGERCRVYVAKADGGTHYYTWCEDPDVRAVEAYDNAVEAIRAGLKRALRVQAKVEQ